jgi:hypothetical protein
MSLGPPWSVETIGRPDEAASISVMPKFSTSAGLMNTPPLAAAIR